ncbi:kinase-like domain-containing protein [Clohesyomyces aquaticus]|uniref:Kinase-like domain-containing protein n=1 Tax=Clohesyomyces aquaticus TaxID=1231657 RepID=A0A1Y1Z707_9PLEO|nr:kinase-like domain-containing protein [Clohesyomyces aquaticus]
MHLPPLDVAVYPVVTMSHGRHGGRSTRPLSSTSTSSSASSTRTTAVSTTTPDFTSIQKVIRNVFRSSKITVQQVERLQGRLHQVYLARLADGSSLVLKCPPPFNTRMLRHEKHSLETERKTLETLREYTQLSVPQVIKYDSQGGTLGLPFLMTSYLPGRKLSEQSSILSASERKTIDRTLGAYVRSLTALSATQFGPTHRVFAKKGSKSWREAFLALLESALRDAEDMLVTVPYDSIRYYVGRHTQFLDEVTEPRLVALNCCDPDNVLLDEQTKEVTGLVGFSNVIWGDPLMSGGIADGSESFFEGYGQCPTRTTSERARISMYTTYRAVLQIVSHYYRPHLDIDELEARRALTYALNNLAQT